MSKKTFIIVVALLITLIAATAGIAAKHAADKKKIHYERTHCFD